MFSLHDKNGYSIRDRQSPVIAKKNRHAPPENFFVRNDKIAIVYEIVIQLLSRFTPAPPANGGYGFGNNQI